MTGFDDLRDTLFGDERRRINDIEHRLNDREELATTVAPALAGALRIAGRNGNDIAEALQDSFIATAALSSRRNSFRLSEALAPIMGTAIRKAITSAMRGLMEQIETISQLALSLKGLRWRWEAWRSGIPFEKVVVKHTTRFHVEEIYFVHKPSGLLLEHVSDLGTQTTNSDAVAAMLLAINDFIKDAVLTSKDDALQAVDLGERLLWLVHGEQALLACVIFGAPPAEFRHELAQTLDEIHSLYHEQLRDFLRTNDRGPIIAEHLTPLLRRDIVKPERSVGNKMRTAVVILLLAVLLFLPPAYWLWQTYQERQTIKKLSEAFGTESGITVFDVKRHGDKYLLRGVADPLAVSKVDELVKRAGVDVSQIETNFAPVLSLEPGLVKTRVMQMLAPPSTAEVEVRNRTLTIKGAASHAWKRHAALISDALPLFDSVDMKELRIEEATQLTDLAQRIAESKVYFANLVQPTDETQQSLGALTDDIRRYVATAREVDLQPCIRVVGQTDGLGNTDANSRLREQRVRWVSTHLQNAGIGGDVLVAETGSAEGGNNVDVRARRVDVMAETRQKGSTCINVVH